MKALIGPFDRIFKSGRIGAEALDELVYIAQSGTFQKPLLIRDPLTASSQNSMGAHHGGSGKSSSQFRQLPGVDIGSARVMQREVGPPAPFRRSGIPQTRWVRRMRQIPPQDSIHREFGDDQIAWDTSQVEHEGLDMKAALLRLGQLMFDNVKIPVMDIDPTALDFKPRSAVKDTATPATYF
ncbi:hypothetical protein QFZ40_000290 [Arthrobacter pascens]|uniref:hypothetical protein n=1 Tax=Arthrobacter pascens TaxID=1677 RepID=UPI002789BA1B|nr:hypothetical protein [Arthrobacter pascens]MDQ0632381.1 hypothetical protein [Arthrobacter pascens]